MFFFSLFSHLASEVGKERYFEGQIVARDCLPCGARMLTVSTPPECTVGTFALLSSPGKPLNKNLASWRPQSRQGEPKLPSNCNISAVSVMPLPLRSEGQGFTMENVHDPSS